MMGLIGKLYWTAMVIINIYKKDWPLEYIIYTATLPSAITGADIAIFASCFAYISDVSTVADRTIRITILDAFYLSTMPTGVALGKFTFTNLISATWKQTMSAVLDPFPSLSYFGRELTNVFLITNIHRHSITVNSYHTRRFKSKIFRQVP